MRHAFLQDETSHCTHLGPVPVQRSQRSAHVGLVTTACVSSRRDWAVYMASHMQQNMGMLFDASIRRWRPAS